MVNSICCSQNKFKFQHSDWTDWSCGIGCQIAGYRKLECSVIVKKNNKFSEFENKAF